MNKWQPGFWMLIYNMLVSSILLALLLIPHVPAAGMTAQVTQHMPSAAELRAVWRPVLGQAGARIPDQVIAEQTPPCLAPTSASQLVQQAESLRQDVIANLSLDMAQRAHSAQLQRRLDVGAYWIDVVRLEVVPGFLLPLNVYVPKMAVAKSAPLVLAIPGCGSGVESDYIQVMGANLARMGMVVVVPEGFCANGARAAVEKVPHYNYANEMLGGSGDVDLFLQELVSTVTWALAAYPQIDPTHIGAAGYSYGGQMASMLAAIDTRISSLSVPATYIGDPCDRFALNGDIAIEQKTPDFVWSAPPSLPILPISWRIPLLYPRALHLTVGTADPGANPRSLDAVMTYARKLYALGGHEANLLYRTDDLAHLYSKNRRQDTYEWFAHTLLAKPLAAQPEAAFVRVPAAQLRVNIQGTKTTAQLLAETVDAEVRQRFTAVGTPRRSQAEIGAAVRSLFPPRPRPALTRTLVWQGETANVVIRAYQVEAADYRYPVFVFENSAQRSNDVAFYLPTGGVYQELESITNLLARYHTVISMDYLGVGELKSDRLMLHTFSRYLMYDEPLLRLNVELLRNELAGLTAAPVDLYASGWTTSLTGLLLKWLAPEQVASIHIRGVPPRELLSLKTGRPLPNLLLWGGLLDRLTVRELAMTMPGRRYLFTTRFQWDVATCNTIVGSRAACSGYKPNAKS